MGKTFTTVNEAVEKANEFGITATTIAAAIGMSRQNFHNKLKANGSTFTAVHVNQVNDYLEKEFTAVHEKLLPYLNLKTFTPVNNLIREKEFTAVHEPTNEATFTRVSESEKFIWDEEKAKREYEELQKRKLANPDDDDILNQLPF